MLETGDLFGLHRRFRIVTEPVYIMVYPKVIPLPGYDLASRRPIGEIRLTHRLFEDPTRIAGIRAYQPGDPMNRIHWKATARTGVLHSKVYDASTIAGATILLDFHRDSFPAKNEPGRSELAVTTAVALANAVSLMGQPIGLITNGRDAADRIRLRDEVTQALSDPWVDRKATHERAAMLKKDDRLRPLIVPPGRGPEGFTRIHEVMARRRAERRPDLRPAPDRGRARLPAMQRSSRCSASSRRPWPWRWGTSKRQGFAVSVVLMALDEIDRIDSAGPLLAEGLAVRAVPMSKNCTASASSNSSPPSDPAEPTRWPRTDPEEHWSTTSSRRSSRC